MTRRLLKKSVLVVRRSSLVSRRSQAEDFLACEMRSRDTVFALADCFSILPEDHDQLQQEAAWNWKLKVETSG